MKTFLLILAIVLVCAYDIAAIQMLCGYKVKLQKWIHAVIPGLHE